MFYVQYVFNLYAFCDLQNVGTSHDRIPVKSLSNVLANTVSEKNIILNLVKHNIFVSYPVLN
jgi:hypothetical protein